MVDDHPISLEYLHWVEDETEMTARTYTLAKRMWKKKKEKWLT